MTWLLLGSLAGLSREMQQVKTVQHQSQVVPGIKLTPVFLCLCGPVTSHLAFQTMGYICDTCIACILPSVQ